MCVCVCVYISIYMSICHTERERERENQTNTNTVYIAYHPLIMEPLIPISWLTILVSRQRNTFYSIHERKLAKRRGITQIITLVIVSPVTRRLTSMSSTRRANRCQQITQKMTLIRDSYRRLMTSVHKVVVRTVILLISIKCLFPIKL